MTNELISHLQLSLNDYIQITNGDITSPSFAINALIHHYAKTNDTILLICLSENISHYNAIATKCGIYIKNKRDDNSFKAIDILNHTEEFVWNRFTTEVFNEIQQLTANGLLLIDDISILLSLGIECKQIYCFVHNLHVKCLRNGIKLIIGSHFPNEDDDEHLNRLVISLIHKSDLWCEIDKIRTGFSSLISGTVKINNMHDDSRKEMHYKLNDRSVKLMPIGS